MKFKWKDFEIECTVDEFEDLFVRGVFDPNLIIGVKRETAHDRDESHFVPVYGCQIPMVRDIPLNLAVSKPAQDLKIPGNSRNDKADTPVKDEPKCVMVVAHENRKTDDTARDEFVHIMGKVHHTLTHDTAMWNPELKHNANSAYVVINLDNTRLDEARIFQYLVNGCAHITGDARGAYVVETETDTSYLICKGFPDKPQYSMKVILFRDQDGISGVHFRFNTADLAESAVTTIKIENEPCSPLAQFGEACVRLLPRFSMEEHERIDGERRIAEDSVRGVEAAAKKTSKPDKSGVSVW